MPEKQKSVHNAYCNYEVAKAKQPSRIYSVHTEGRITKWEKQNMMQFASQSNSAIKQK